MTDAIDVADDPQPEYWFICAAVLVGKDTEGQVAQLVCAQDMPTARMAFVEGLMALHGPAGLGVRGVACTPVTGLRIERLAAEAEPVSAHPSYEGQEPLAPNPFPVGDEV